MFSRLGEMVALGGGGGVMRGGSRLGVYVALDDGMWGVWGP